MLISGRAGDGTCGVGDHTLFLASELAREIEIDLLYRQGRGPREEYREVAEGRERLHLLPLGGFGSSALGEILRLVRQRRPDIVHLQYPAREYRFSLMPLWLAWMRSQLRPAVLVLTLHEYSEAHPPRRLVASPLLNHADLTLVPALAEYRSLRARRPQLSLRYVPNGCFFARVVEPVRAPSREREPALLYFGLPSKTKQFSRLLEVVRAVRQVLGEVELKLQFVGRIPGSSARGPSAVSAFGKGAVQFHPFLPVNRLRELAERSLLLFFPFEFDTHRSSLINSLVWETPIACLGYAAGIAEEYGGMLPVAPSGDDRAFASYLADFVNLLRADFAAASREQLERQRALRERLDVARIAQAHLTLYNQALAGDRFR